MHGPKGHTHLRFPCTVKRHLSFFINKKHKFIFCIIWSMYILWKPPVSNKIYTYVHIQYLHKEVFLHFAIIYGANHTEPLVSTICDQIPKMTPPLLSLWQETREAHKLGRHYLLGQGLNHIPFFICKYQNETE